MAVAGILDAAEGRLGRGDRHAVDPDHAGFERVADRGRHVTIAGLSRPSTPFLLLGRKGVDTRDNESITNQEDRAGADGRADLPAIVNIVNNNKKLEITMVITKNVEQCAGFNFLNPPICIVVSSTYGARENLHLACRIRPISGCVQKPIRDWCRGKNEK